MSMAATTGRAHMMRRVVCPELARLSRDSPLAERMHTLRTMFSYDIPVLHLVNRFWIGGAERQFVERLRRHPPGFRAIVGCLEASGPMLEQVRSFGYEPEVFPLNGSMLRPNTAVQ